MESRLVTLKGYINMFSNLNFSLKIAEMLLILKKTFAKFAILLLNFPKSCFVALYENVAAFFQNAANFPELSQSFHRAFTELSGIGRDR